MWRSGWALVPSEDVHLLVGENTDADVEFWDYPSVGFPDGEVEGSDLNRLWSLVRGSTTEETVWGELLRDAPDGSEKVALVRSEAAAAFADLSESRMKELAAAWQNIKSGTSSLPWWKQEDITEAIRELTFLARQQLRLRPAWELLMVWFL
jgi:hypothetical protein